MKCLLAFMNTSNTLYAKSLLFAAFLMSSLFTEAAITVNNYWSIGAGDGGVSGGAVSGFVDSVGGINLTAVSGAPLYSSSSMNSAFSSLSASFSPGDSVSSNNVLSPLNNNFGFEGFFNIGSATPNGTTFFVNGGNDGFGFFLTGAGDVVGLFGGVDFVGSSAAVRDTWVHYAVVRDSGVATLYVNGAAAGATSLNAPLTATGGVSIGNQGANYTGGIDDVRIFTFIPGQFQVTDLLYTASVPEPSAYIVLAISILFLFCGCARSGKSI
jgi:hypothetical protein